ASPTTTLTGILTFPLAAWSKMRPVNVPAVSPDPGRFAFVIETVTTEGAVPEASEVLSQFPPSAVLLLRLQFSVPDPPLRIGIDSLGGVCPPVWREKFVAPGSASKNGVPEGTIVNVTGTVMLTAADVNTICPV